MNHSSEEQATCDLVLTKSVEVEEQNYTTAMVTWAMEFWYLAMGSNSPKIHTPG